MLTRAIARTAVSLAAAALLLEAAQLPAVASDTPGSDGPFGGVQCGQSYSPECIITAGTPAAPGSGQPGGGSAVGAPVTPGSPGGCAGTVSPIFGCIPPGCHVTAQTLSCPIGGLGAGPGGVAPVPAPGALAARARALLVLPRPVIDSSPSPGRLQLTQLPIWLWVGQATWATRSKTATVPGLSVTATATPVSVTWNMGNGATIRCNGRGTPYAATDSPASPSPDCGYTYLQSSAGQPGGAYHAVVTVAWDITWTGPAGTGGTLAPLHTSATADFRVAEAHALNIASGE